MIFPQKGQNLQKKHHQSNQLHEHWLGMPAFSLTQLTTEPTRPVGFLQGTHFFLLVLVFFLTIQYHLYI